MDFWHPQRHKSLHSALEDDGDEAMSAACVFCKLSHHLSGSYEVRPARCVQSNPPRSHSRKGSCCTPSSSPPSYYSFVIDCDLFLASPKTYPVAAGLKPTAKGIGNGGFRHESEKNTGWVVAGLNMGGGAGRSIVGAGVGMGEGGIA